MWYYIGPHGQIGPLGDQQIRNLIQGNIIGPQTPVWRQGMTNWAPAGQMTELAMHFTQARTFGAQPGYQPQPFQQQMPYTQFSSRSRTVAGVLNMLIPGVGRLYLGHTAMGIMQLVVWVATLHFCCAGGIWGAVDGIVILTGGVERDGDGLPLAR